MPSIRHRLTLLLLTGLAAVVAIGAALLYPAVRSILIAEFDSALEAKLRALTTLPEPGREGINLNFTQRILSEFQRSENPEYFEVWLQDGSVFARSPSLGTNGLDRRVGPESKPAFWNLTLPDGRPGRAVGIGFATEREETGLPAKAGVDSQAPGFTISLVLARDAVRLNRVLRYLLIGIFTGGALLIALMGWVVRLGTCAGLRPVHALAGQVKSIEAGTLRTRLSVTALPAELQPIVEQLNEMIGRLNAAFERERRFTGNAAHELLTPIAELRSMAEAAQKWSGDAEATAQFASDTLETARQMEHLVANLLALARAETDMALVRLEKVNLSELLDEVRLCFADRISAKDLRLEWEVSVQTIASTDRVLCKSICYNLLDNAVEYTPVKSRVRCRLTPQAQGFELRIGNTVEHLSAPDLEDVFEPLWRKDKARSARSHAGLGLPLAQAFARTLRADIAASLPEPGWFEVVVRLPGS